jgi:hypothetical protein
MSIQSTPTSQSAPETEYYHDATVLVTNTRAVIENKTYAMSNITSVSMATIPANRTAGIICIVIGVIGLVAGLSSSSSQGTCAGIGILFAIIGVVLLMVAKTQYVVRVGSASGESNALQSTDQTLIQKIVNAMNEAIIKRG